MQDNKAVYIFAPGPLGGAETVLLAGIPELIKLGFKIFLVIIKETRAPEHAELFAKLAKEKNIPFEIIESNSRFDTSMLKSINQLINKIAPNIIHAHGIKAIVFSSIIKNRQYKLISTHHGKTSHTLTVKLYEYLEYLGLKRSDHVIAVSNPMYKGLSIKLNKFKLSTVLNPLSIDSSLQEKSFKQTDCLTVLYVGRLSPEKGCEILVKAIEKLPEHFNIHCKIVGDGPQKEELKKLTKRYNLESKITFEGFQKNIRPYYLETHCLIMPSFREGLPMTLIEATANSLPIIGSHVGGIPDLVQENGILIEPNNSQDLSKAILELHSNYQYYSKQASQMAAIIDKKYSATRWAKETIDIYKNVLSQE